MNYLLISCVTIYLIDKKRRHKFPWFEDIHDFADKLVIRRLGEVGFKADIRELWFGGDVNRPVSSLERQPISIIEHRATFSQKLKTCSLKWLLTSVFIPFMEYPQGLNIVASITEPGIRSRIPLICEDTTDNLKDTSQKKYKYCGVHP